MGEEDEEEENDEDNEEEAEEQLIRSVIRGRAKAILFIFWVFPCLSSHIVYQGKATKVEQRAIGLKTSSKANEIKGRTDNETLSSFDGLFKLQMKL